MAEQPQNTPTITDEVKDIISNLPPSDGAAIQGSVLPETVSTIGTIPDDTIPPLLTPPDVTDIEKFTGQPSQPPLPKYRTREEYQTDIEQYVDSNGRFGVLADLRRRREETHEEFHGFLLDNDTRIAPPTIEESMPWWDTMDVAKAIPNGLFGFAGSVGKLTEPLFRPLAPFMFPETPAIKRARAMAAEARAKSGEPEPQLFTGDEFGPQRSVIGAMLKPLAQLTFGFLTVKKLVGGLPVIGSVGAKATKAERFVSGISQGAMAEVLSFEGNQERLSNFLLDSGWPGTNNALIRYLAADPSDSDAEGRFKTALESLPIFAGAEVVFHMARGVKNVSVARMKAGKALSKAKEAKILAKQIEPVKKALEKVRRQSEQVKVTRKKPPKDGIEKTPLGIIKTDVVDKKGQLQIIDTVNKVNNGTLDIEDLLDSELINWSRFGSKDEAKVAMQAIGEALSPERIKHLKEAGKLSTILKNAEALGLDADELVAGLEKMGGITGTMADTVTAGRLMRDKVMSEFADAVKVMHDAGATDEQIRITLKPLIQAAGYFHSATADIATNISRTLNSFKILSVDDWGQLAGDDLSRLISSIITHNGDRVRIAGSLRLEPSFGNRAVGAVNSLAVHGIMMGARLQETNFITTFAHLFLSPLEGAAGALAAGDKTSAKIALRFFLDFWGQLQDSFRIGKMAAVHGRSFSNPKFSVIEERNAITSTFMGSGGDPTKAVFKGGRVLGSKKVGALVDLAGAVVGAGSRLSIGVDEMAKSIASKTHVRSKAIVDGLDLDLDPDDLASFVGDRMDQAFGTSARLLGPEAREIAKKIEIAARAEAKELGLSPIETTRLINKNTRARFGPDAEILDPQAALHAQDITFQRNLQYGEGIISTLGKMAQDGVSSVPAFRQVALFIKTPTNLMQQGLDRSPVGFLQKQLRQDLHSPDPLIASKARGKLISGAAITIVAGGAAMMGKLQGRLSTDPAIRRQQEEAGVQPYSYVTTDEDGNKEYFPWAGQMDPFVTIFKMAADITQVSEVLEKEYGEYGLFDWLGGSMKAIGHNLIHNYWIDSVSGFTDAISKDDKSWDRWVRNRITAFVPTVMREFSNDPYITRLDGAIDGAFSRMPNSEGMPKLYNGLGEKIPVKPGMTSQALNPFYSVKESTDVVTKELNSLNQGFSQPSYIVGNLDLRHFTDSKTGKDAFEAYNMLIERPFKGIPTLRERIADEIENNPEYQRLPKLSNSPTPSLRVGIIQTIIAEYRKQAMVSLQDRNPDLRDAIDADIIAVQNEQQGITP